MFFKNKDDEKENKTYLPKESKPVISRTGKIGRVQLDNENTFQAEVKAEELSSDISISDSNFEEESKVQEKRTKNSAIRTVKNKEKAPFPFMTVLMSVICTALFMSMVVNFVQINEYTKDVSELQENINKLNNKKNELNTELSKKNDLDKVKDSLKDLGMVDDSLLKDPTHITPEKNDSVEDFVVEEEEESLVTVVLNALAENFSNTWNKFLGNE